MKKEKILSLFFIFSFGVSIGFFFFFPFALLKDRIGAMLATQTGLQLSMEDFSSTTGLGLGLTRGGLFAFKGSQVKLRIPNLLTLKCEELLISPEIWPMFITQSRMSVECAGANQGRVLIYLTATPFWKPASIDVQIDFESMNFNRSIRLADPQFENLQMILKGKLVIQNFKMESRSLPRTQIALEIKSINIPPFSVAQVSLPELELSKANLSARALGSNLDIQQLSLGASDDLLQGYLKGQLKLSPQNFPENGNLSGQLKFNDAHPSFAASQSSILAMLGKEISFDLKENDPKWNMISSMMGR